MMGAAAHSGFAGRFMKRFVSASALTFNATRTAFEGGEVAQTLRDVIALLFAAVFVIVTGLGVAFALFILFCVRC